ncbi:MAG TPA: T9SS type A sorting domain-containing protein [Candidatus Acidoferrales bacterium]|nr:T9SS type A sorting domain-containing protein [Candidatus Acidoferrales bacterium]
MKHSYIFLLAVLISSPLSAQMRYYVSTDSVVYHYGDSIHIMITAVNTGSTPDTLYLSGCDVSYYVDNFSLLGHRPCPLVIVGTVIPPHDSVSWSGAPELPPYPVNKDTLPAGRHAIVGQVGRYWISDTLWITVSSLNAVRHTAGNPQTYTLENNYPDPFNPSTVITYQLPVNSFVMLKVYDVLGREVRTLVDKHQSAGRYFLRFDAANLPSGMYFYRLQAGTFSATKKLVVLK